MNKDKVLDFFSVVRAIALACVIVGLLGMGVSLVLMATISLGFVIDEGVRMIGAAALIDIVFGGAIVLVASVARHLVGRIEFRSEQNERAPAQP